MLTTKKLGRGALGMQDKKVAELPACSRLSSEFSRESRVQLGAPSPPCSHPTPLSCARTLALVAAACLVLTGCGPPGLRALRKGDRLVQSGKYDEAIEALTQATNLLANEALPVQAKARNLLGLAYHRGGNAARARACYEAALALDRNGAAEADYNLGCLEAGADQSGRRPRTP